MLANRFLDTEYLEGLYKSRNKTYGSYLIIKKHEKRYFLSFCATICAFVLFLVGYSYLPMLFNDDIIFDVTYNESQIILSDYQQLVAPVKTKTIKKSNTIKITNEEEPKEINDSLKNKKKELTKKDSTNILPDSLAMLANQTEENIIKKDSIIENENTLKRIVDRIPEFPGGESALKEYLAKSIVYPEKSKKKKIFGKVKVAFIVEENGKITNITLIKSVHSSLDNEVMNAIRNMPSWQPSYKNGKPIRFYCTIPVSFEPVVIQN